MPTGTTTRDAIKKILVEALNLEGTAPECIDDDGPLFGEGLGLDSVDALELVVALEKAYGMKINSHEIGRDAFASVAALAAYIDARVAAERAGAGRG
jgi:acyl carrier protein